MKGVRHGAGILLVSALTVGLAGCAVGAPSSGDAEGRGGAVTVFAAASLTAAFTDLADEFERAHPGTTVALNFAGSAELATQIVEGAPADVFAAADHRTMALVADAGLTARAPQDFATNVLVIAVPAHNPAGIETFADLADPALKVVLCAPEVPCGAAAARLQEATGVELAPVSEETSVTGVLGKVTSGEADAGLVYVTDVRTAGAAVDSVPLAATDAAANTYPIAELTDAEAPAAARAFVRFVLSAPGQAVLTAAGFGPP